MRYSNTQYASALHQALKEKSSVQRKAVLKNFLLILRKQRIAVTLPRILQEVEKQYLKEEGMRKVMVELAAPRKNLKADIEKILGSKVLLEQKTNPELLAGIRILVDDELLVDASGRRQLGKLFLVNNIA